MAKDKRIPAKDFIAASEKHYDGETQVDVNGLQVMVRKHISLAEMEAFVTSVVSACFNKDSGEYAPEAKHFAYANNIILFYTNVNLPSDFSKRYDAMMHSSILNVVTEHIDAFQLRAITESIDERIDAMLAERTSVTGSKIASFLESIVSAMDDVEKMVGTNGAGGFMNMLSALNGANGASESGSVVETLK